MTLVRKFSQFVAQNVTSVVGLTSGANSIGPNSGSGGSGAVTQVITQNNTFTVGQWVRFDVASNLYVTALATTPLNAEVIGVVIATSPPTLPHTQFTLQQSGYITTAQGVFTGLTPGEPYFLDTVTAGNMVPTDVTIDGEVSRPVFVPDTPTSGWVLPYRGIIAEGGIDTGGGGPPPVVVDSNVVTITQNAHGLNPGNWVRITTPQAGPQVHYVLADASTLANSQAVGVVIQVVNANQFILQFAGYVATAGSTTAPFEDVNLAALTPSTVYYLSSTPNSGALTSVDPITTGGVSKPLYVSEQTIGTVNRNAGYILPQRPSGDGSAISAPVFLGELNAANNFSSTTILNGFNEYFILLQPGPTGSAGGIYGTAGVNSSIGIQPYIGGSFIGGSATSFYTSGVNTTAGQTTATFWGGCNATASAESMVIFPALTRLPVIYSGFAYLSNLNSTHIMHYDFFCIDVSPSPVVGYTSKGWAGNETPGIATGLRLFFSNSAAITPGSQAYFSVYGIPNS